MKKNEKAKSNLILYIIIGVLSVLLIIALLFIIFNNKDGGKKKKKVTEDNTKETLRLLEAPGDEYEVFEASSYPLVQVISINGKQVDYKTSYYSAIVEKVYKLDKDAYIISLSAIYNDQMETYDNILYAVDKDANVLWFTSDKSQCETIGSDLCIGLNGVSNSSMFGYSEYPFKIENNKISIVTSIYYQDPIWSACLAESDSVFAAEYEMEYKGKGKFSNIKTIQSITAGEYLKQRQDNGETVDCTLYE